MNNALRKTKKYIYQRAHKNVPIDRSVCKWEDGITGGKNDE